MQFKLFSIPATGDSASEEELNRFLRSHRAVAARSRKRFRRKMALCHDNYTSGRWTEEETARHVEPLLAFVRRAESHAFCRRVLESIEGSCPKEARTA